MSGPIMGRKYKYVLDKSRVIAHLDVDCFACQVTLRHRPELKDKPFGVLRPSTSILESVSYEAIEFGVTKGMTPKEAQKKCPQLVVVSRKDIGTDKYWEASQQLVAVVKELCKGMIVEKASIDDFFIDLTDKCEKYMKDKYKYERSFLENLEVVVETGNRQNRFSKNNRLLDSNMTEAAVFVTHLCDEILNKTGLICSAGISVNKLLARIATNLNKPDRITLIESKAGIARVFESIAIESVTGFGGKKGQDVKKTLNVSTLIQLRNFRRQQLMRAFGHKDGNQLWEMCRGIDHKPVVHRSDVSSISCSSDPTRGFYCKSGEVMAELRRVCQNLVRKLKEDLNKNRRIAHKIMIEITTKRGANQSSTMFTMAKNAYDANDIYQNIYAKGFPYITDKVPDFIKGFRITAFEFKNVCSLEEIDPMFAITDQLHGLYI